jgi:hypothetical protein
MLNIVDEFTRAALGRCIDHRLGSTDVIDTLADLLSLKDLGQTTLLGSQRKAPPRYST